MQERRHTERRPIDLKAKVKFGGASSYTDCVVNNLNFNGIKISLKHKLFVDKFLNFTIMLSEEVFLSLTGWVVWHKRFAKIDTYGIYFTNLNETQKEIIYSFTIKSHGSHGLEDSQEKGGEEMERKMEDRRVFERFSAKIALRFLDLNSNREGQASTQDISAKGIGVNTDQALVRNTPLEMWLKVPDKGEPLYVRGEVVWSKMVGPNSYRNGVELEKANLMGLSRVLRII